MRIRKFDPVLLHWELIRKAHDVAGCCDHSQLTQRISPKRHNRQYADDTKSDTSTVCWRLRSWNWKIQ